MLKIKERNDYMMNDKMYIVNKLFNNDTIRAVWDKEEEKYYISVVDIVGIVSESKDGRKYWNKLKQRLKDEGNETVTNCHQLKLKAQDGKYRLTDVVDIEGMFRIIESIPSKNVEPIKQWLAHLGSERIDEVFDPSLAAKRAIDLYRAKGYDESWISKRMKGIQDRKKLTDVWKDCGVNEGKEYAILTNEIYKQWSGMTAKEYKNYKGLRKESLRDNMTDIEVALTDLGELATRELANVHKPRGLEQNKTIARRGGNIAKITKDNLEKELGRTVVTDSNSLSYRYINDNLLDDNNDKKMIAD